MTFLKDHLLNLLMSAFPNCTKTSIIAFIQGCFDPTISSNAETFKQHLRDFLINIKEFQSEDNSDLYLAETEARVEAEQASIQQYRASIPGLMKPAEIDDDDL